MSSTLNTSSDHHQAERYPGAPLKKKEMYGSKERMEDSVAPALTVAQETKLWRRIDLRLMPVMSLIFLFSSMDRGNIGNAKLEGLMTQLNLTGNKFNIASMMYFIPYILLEFPSKFRENVGTMFHIGSR
ncbi:hypothetical protein PAXRUDRAFT_544574 [Paxillus rubicundulus Ve08.2h10]|uniref:Major facilitator superfamily (MFS) profile domain-containing protein n=1 Tax=Paxillus rubicundulus Ve08.2h10 TaxID=930991 RepID=A0A0D0CGS8_9AGAM|nr:hypothetical protein PAXRUDRAFT_544574 [Paxillus rubicundulus Ve08.2h10]